MPKRTTKSHKRHLSAGATPGTNVSTPPTRSSKRLRTAETDSVGAKATPTKSKYFEYSEEEEEDNKDDEIAGDEGSQSGYEDTQQSQAESSATSSDSADEESESDDQEKSKRKGRKTTKKTASASRSLTHNKSDLWREGVKTGLGPGKAVFIEKPKARGDGGIPYVPERIHAHTMEFLKDLKKNNDRIWLKAHDADYRTSWKDFESFVQALTEKIAEVDDTIPELPPKDLVFRIYRDVRFSSDPTPYKPHFSAAWSRTGRKGPYAGYYLHLQPGGECFVGSGLWHPDAAPLALLRADIDQRSDRIRNVLTDQALRKHVFGGIGKDVKKALQVFCKHNEENALKTKPKGYEADNPNIELLRLRSFTVSQKINDQDMLSPNGIDRIVELISAMKPFVSYLNSVVMPDEEPEHEDTDDSHLTSSEASCE